MLMLNLLKITANMCRITPQIYTKLYQSYQKIPHSSTFGKYYTPQNLLQIFGIIKHSKINRDKKLEAYSQLQKKLCRNTSDMQFNILANIFKERSMIFAEKNQNNQSIKQIQYSIKAFNQMKQPNQIQGAQLLQIAGNLNARIGNRVKAQKYLKDAQHLYSSIQQQILDSQELGQTQKQATLKQLNVYQARVLSQLCLIHLQQGHNFQAQQFLNKAFQRWLKIEKRNTLGFLLINKYKCRLYLQSKQDDLAIKNAQQYLQKYPQVQPTKYQRLYFMQLLSQKGINTYQQIIKQKVDFLRTKVSKNQLTSILNGIGISYRPSQQGKQDQKYTLKLGVRPKQSQTNKQQNKSQQQTSKQRTSQKINKSSDIKTDKVKVDKKPEENKVEDPTKKEQK